MCVCVEGVGMIVCVGGYGYDSVWVWWGRGGYKLTLWTVEESNAPELTSCSCNE